MISILIGSAIVGTAAAHILAFRILHAGGVLFSDKPLEPILCCLAHRADQRGSVAGAEIPAHPASPYRERESHISQAGGCSGQSSLSRASWWPSFRDGPDRDLIFQDRVADIEGTIAGIELIEVRIPVITGADDIPVLLAFSEGYPA